MVVAFRKSIVMRQNKFSNIKHNIDSPVRMYREIQLLTSCYTKIHQRRVIPLIMLHDISFFSFAFYTLLSKWMIEGFVPLPLFGTGEAIGSGTMLYIFHLPFKLYVENHVFGLLHQLRF